MSDTCRWEKLNMESLKPLDTRPGFPKNMNPRMLKGLFLGTVCDFSLPAGAVARGQSAAAAAFPLLFDLPGVQQQAGDSAGAWAVAIRVGPTAMLVMTMSEGACGISFFPSYLGYLGLVRPISPQLTASDVYDCFCMKYKLLNQLTYAVIYTCWDHV